MDDVLAVQVLEATRCIHQQAEALKHLQVPVASNLPLQRNTVQGTQVAPLLQERTAPHSSEQVGNLGARPHPMYRLAVLRISYSRCEGVVKGSTASKQSVLGNAPAPAMPQPHSLQQPGMKQMPCQASAAAGQQ